MEEPSPKDGATPKPADPVDAITTQASQPGRQAAAVDFTAPAMKATTLLGHPVGLYVLFFTEMWERFSFYGMRALLMLYMVNYFRWSQRDASSVYKWYTSLVYLTPLLGGYLADRYLGNRRAVVIGAILMAIGHFLMAFEPLPAFSAALIFLILGNGFFKPNMSTQVGRLYPPNDPRRDGAYTIFYMGINLGAFLSPLICGWLAENTLGGYHAGFTAAGIGMVAGLIIYVVGGRWVIELNQRPAHPGAGEEDVGAAKRPDQAATEAITTHTSPIQAAAEPLPSLQPGAERLGRPSDPDPTNGAAAASAPISEAVAERTPSRLPWLNHMAPQLLAFLGIGLALGAPLLALVKVVAVNTAISLEIAAVCAVISAWIMSRVHEAVRDRVLAIYILAIFVVFFWAAFEQAGNAMNLWADKITDRYLTQPMPPPPPFEVVKEGSDATQTAGAAPAPHGFLDRWVDMFKPLPHGQGDQTQTWSAWWSDLWNPVPTAWFQSINALAIFVLAPVFAFMWTFLDRRGLNPSVPTKMAFGVLLMASAFALMIGAAQREDQPSSAPLQASALPPGVAVNRANQLMPAPGPADEGLPPEPYLAGRLVYEPAAHALQMRGVLSDLDRDRIVRDTAPADYVAKIKELQKKTQAAPSEPLRVEVQLNREPPGFDLRYAGFSKRDISYDPAMRTLTATIRLADKDVKALLVAGGAPQLRTTLDELMIASSVYRVSSSWLFWFYILATLGELCLSPVGLSMVSKLAPVKFATMLMGLWLLTSFFGNFAAGAFGEIWGTVTPVHYFLIFVAALGGASLVLFVLVRKIVGIMHGVN